MSTVKLGGAEKPAEIDLSKTLPLLLEWRRAVAYADKAKRKADALAEQYKATLTTLGVESGYLLDENGVKKRVVTCKKTATFQGARFKKDRPDLVEQFTIIKKVEALDTEALKKQFPGVYKEYQSVSIRPDWKAVDSIVTKGSDDE